MGPVFAVGNVELYPFLIHTDGTVGLYFQYMIGKPMFGAEDKRRELLARLNAIGLILPESAITRRPAVSLRVFAEGDRAARSSP